MLLRADRSLPYINSPQPYTSRSSSYVHQLLAVLQRYTETTTLPSKDGTHEQTEHACTLCTPLADRSESQGAAPNA